VSARHLLSCTSQTPRQVTKLTHERENLMRGRATVIVHCLRRATGGICCQNKTHAGFTARRWRLSRPAARTWHVRERTRPGSFIPGRQACSCPASARHSSPTCLSARHPGTHTGRSRRPVLEATTMAATLRKTRPTPRGSRPDRAKPATTWWISGMVRLVGSYFVASLAPPLPLSIRRVAPPGSRQRAFRTTPPQPPGGPGEAPGITDPRRFPHGRQNHRNHTFGTAVQGRRLNT
jgi:hypothetical protein